MKNIAILMIDDECFLDLDKRIIERDSFTRVVSVTRSLENAKSEGVVCVWFRSNQKVAIGQYKKGLKVATNQKRISLRNLIFLDKPLTEIISLIHQKNIRTWFDKKIPDEFFVCPPEKSTALSEVLLIINPDIEKLSIKKEPKKYPTPQSADIHAYEIDAINTALKIVGMGSLEKISGDGSDNPFSFLEEKRCYLEDGLIDFDLHHFGDFKLETDDIQYCTLVNGQNRIHIKNINRNELEHKTGADLILYNENHSKYLFIQYKKFDKSKKYYPLNDESGKRECQKMNELMKKREDFIEVSAQKYSLNSDLFYFKLCCSLKDTPKKDGMVKGMYLPLDQWNLLLKDGITKTDLGATVFSYETINKWISNSLFVDLFKRGLIGITFEKKELGTFINEEKKENLVILASFHHGQEPIITDSKTSGRL